MSYKITNDQNYSDIADAIRGKLGSQDTFLPSEMASAIESIPTGGESSELKTIFIDYDGTVLHEYTSAEIASMSQLPVLPSRAGLTCQEWNWTLAELQAFAKPVIVGANYVTDDGKTRVYIDVPDTDKRIYSYIKQSVVNGVVVDWGDGSPTESLSSKTGNLSHTYASSGSYVVTFQILDGYMEVVGESSTGTKLIWSNGNNTERSSGANQYIKKIEFGSGFESTSNAFSCCRNLETVTIPTGMHLYSDAFSEDYSLKCIVIPRGFNSIPSGLVERNYSLKYVSIPDGATIIGAYFAQSCYSITRITIPDSVETIGNLAFETCYSLEHVDLPSGIEVIGQCAFMYTRMHGEVSLSSSVTSIGSQAFSYTDITKLTLDGDAPMGDQAFEQCLKLTEVLITNRSTAIGLNAFNYCRILKKAIIRGTLTEIKNFAFGYCYSLAEIELPNTVTSIGNSSFTRCTSLRSIALPSSLTSIGRVAFSYCEKLEELIVPSGVTTILGSVFASLFSLRKIVFMGDVTSIATNALTTDYSVREYDFTHCTQVPSLASDSCLTAYANRQKIKVPAALYNDWIAATYWSNIASYIEAV